MFDLRKDWLTVVLGLTLAVAVYFMAADVRPDSTAKAVPGSRVCLDIGQEITEEMQLISGSTRSVQQDRQARQTTHDTIRRKVREAVGLTGTALEEMLVTIDQLIRLFETYINAQANAMLTRELAIRDLQDLLQLWVDNDCGPVPARSCEVAGLAQAPRPRPGSEGSRSRREVTPQQLLHDLTTPTGPPVIAQLQPDGTVRSRTSESSEPWVDPRTGQPLQLRMDTTFHRDEVLLIYPFTLHDADGVTIPVVRITGEHGQTGIRGNPGGIEDREADLPWFLGSMHILPTTSSISTPDPRAIPLFTFVVGVGFIAARTMGPRLAAPFGALIQAFQRIHEAEEATRRPPLEARRRNSILNHCGFHVTLTVHARDNVQASAVSVADFVPPAPETTAPPSSTPLLTEPEQDLSSGSGAGSVSYVGSTCGRPNSTWHWQTFVGANGRGYSASFDAKPRDGAFRPVSDVRSFSQMLDPNGREVDWSNRDLKQMWQAYKDRIRTAITAKLSEITVRLSDSDQLGSGDATYMLFKHPEARRMRVRIGRGCDVAPPRHYMPFDNG